MRLTNFAVLAILGVSAHDASQCRENGKFDNDCCAVKGTAQCAGDLALSWGDVCYKGDGWTAFSYYCDDPEGQVVPKAIQKLHDKSKCMEKDRKKDCIATKVSGKCLDKHVQYWGQSKKEGEYEYFCIYKYFTVKQRIVDRHNGEQCQLKKGQQKSECCGKRSQNRCAKGFSTTWSKNRCGDDKETMLFFCTQNKMKQKQWKKDWDIYKDEDYDRENRDWDDDDEYEGVVFLLGLVIVFLTLFIIGVFVYFCYKNSQDTRMNQVEIDIGQLRNENKSLQLQNREMQLDAREQQLQRPSAVPLQIVQPQGTPVTGVAVVSQPQQQVNQNQQQQQKTNYYQ